VSPPVSCSKCGGAVRPPGLVASEWRCHVCGPVLPLHVPERTGHDVTQTISEQVGSAVPLWCPWPLPAGWLVTGMAWAGDDRSGVRATAVACSGPAPLHDGPADVLLIAEEPGVGLGNRFAGLVGADPGGMLPDVVSAPHARMRVDGRDTPMWSMNTPADRVAYVGEARGMWLYAVAWPADAGYVFSDEIVLHDLTQWLPSELVYGAPSPYLHGRMGKGTFPR
jgi:hypothetical protein